MEKASETAQEEHKDWENLEQHGQRFSRMLIVVIFLWLSSTVLSPLRVEPAIPELHSPAEESPEDIFRVEIGLVVVPRF